MAQWQARIFEDFCVSTVKLCIFRDLGFKIELLKADGKVETLDSMGTVDQGTLMLPVGAKEALLEALLSAGVKPKEQSRVEGMLEAQGSHLKDLRHLLKLPA